MLYTNSSTIACITEGAKSNDGVVGPTKDPIEFEGGEFIVNKNKNDAAGKHGADLKALNESPDDYEIVKKDEFEDGGFVYPTFDAKNRRQ